MKQEVKALINYRLERAHEALVNLTYQFFYSIIFLSSHPEH